MSSRNEIIKQKKAIMNARKAMKEFTCLELLDFEEFDSPWIDLFEPLLKQFRRIDSKPTYYKLIGDSKENNIFWIENSLSFLKQKKEWFIVVPKCLQPVWANVRVLDYSKAIHELWEMSEPDNFLIADKSTGMIAKIFFEEQQYEIHIGKCSPDNIKKNN